MFRAALPLALLAACSTAQPAPIAYGDGRGPVTTPARASSAAPPAASEAPNWAAAEGTPLSVFALQPEEAQPFDPAHLPRSHRVGRNETLYEVATLYQVPVLALIAQNRLQPPYALTPGSVLELPPPRFHIVARGEALGDVARRYNVDTRSLALLNRLQAPYVVSVGDRLVLPPLAGSSPTPAAEPAPALAPPIADPHAPRFTWPLRGDILARFGAQSGGARLDGIEIAGREGAAISAAADGEVVYAGSDLPAYGSLVLVRHGDNYVTAYGYARRALVREGQRVRAGEPIAELGARPDGRPRLLFQVRQGAQAVDPAPLLGGMSAH